MSEWQNVKLRDVSLLITKGTTPSTMGGGFQVSGINYIKSESLSYDGNIDQSKFVRVSAEVHEQLRRSQIKEQDILYSIAGINLGKCGLAKKDHLPANTNQAVAIIRIDPQKADPKFIHYYLRNPAFVQQVLNGSAQSAQPNVNLTDIGNFNFTVPNIHSQKAIAAILSALDDKIELNRRMNATLEAMARALFKSWFVDFDPVRAKSEGRQPFGMDAETATLFTSRLVPSTLGDIPEGWTVGTIKELCARVESGGTPSRSEPAYWQDGNVPWLTSGEVRQKIVLDTKEKISLKGLEGSNAKLWPALSTVVAMYGATAGQVTLLGNQMAANQACCALIPATDAHSFVYLKTSQSVSEYEGQATGSAQQNLNQTIVANLQTIIPVRNILAAFQGIVAGHLFTMIQNTKESDSLASMRDYLLPKLISGDIRISDAEKFVEAA